MSAKPSDAIVFSPTGEEHEAMRDQKSALLKAVRPLDNTHIVRGQYAGYQSLPGERMVGEDVEMTLTKHAPNLRPPYQRLLGDALRGVGELFGRDDIVDAQWRIVEPILDNATPVYSYHPGTWGPDEAQALIGADGPWRHPNTAAETFT